MKDMKLGTKIALGFGLLILIAAALGGMAIWEMETVGSESAKLAKEYAPEVAIANDLERNSLLTMYAMRGYAYTEEPTYLKSGNKYLAEVKQHLEEIQELADRSAHLNKLREALPEAKAGVARYAELSEQTVKLNETLAEHRGEMDVAAAQYMQNCVDFLESQNKAMERQIAEGATAEKLTERLSKITMVNDIIGMGNAARVGNFKSQATRDPELLKATIDAFGKVDKKFEDLSAITRQEVNIRQIQNTREAAGQYKSAMEGFLADWHKREELNKERTAVGGQVLESAKNTATAGVEQTVQIAEMADKTLAGAITIMIAGLLGALIIGVLLSIFLIRSITGPINRVIAGLSSGAEQVSSAAGQVSSASQSLAQGASEQASSIEETSASLEEMSSMTSQNAQNAGEADNLMRDAKEVIGRANGSMRQVTSAMESINTASEETSKIIKTIDEIAFQTNLLALNAAVEAARAGEAGAGFAVVADEVRNLAMRAADAAKNTAELIEGTVRQVQDGTNLVATTNDAFTEVETSSAKVAELLAEIASASKEQAQGIGQVNTAVTEMDKVTQQNAANAEESASASEEMNAQAEQMMGYVEELVALVGGNGNGHSRESKKPGRRKALKTSTADYRERLAPSAVSARSSSAVREVTPAELIPFDDEDFKDF